MKLLINESEILYFLKEISKSFLSERDKTELDLILLENSHQLEVINDIKEKIRSGKLKKFLRKIPGKIHSAVEADTQEYFNKVSNFLKSKKELKNKLIEKKFSTILSKLGEDNVISSYQQHKEIHGFVKSISNSFLESCTISRRLSYVETNEDCIIRNTISNENLLINKISNNLPFWFVDSGYTNFLETNKKWHRIVRNHLHNGEIFEAPVDRLGIFKTFPANWRTGGDKILVIEPGLFSANIFNVNIEQWRKDVELQIRKHTDKQIVFREKTPKKKREPLYKHLLGEEYYCVISINSNAATEAIWAGIPVITLDKHITNPISRNKISDINNLLRPHLATWLCMLSYCQFTVDELQNGSAIDLIKKYHANS
jgi:hypothetical protein